MAGLGALAMQGYPAAASAGIFRYPQKTALNIPLGVGNHSLRGMRPSARELVEFAIEHQLDSVQFNTLKPFESLEPRHLESLKAQAKSNDISIYVGVGSISEQSASFSDGFGNARELLNTGIRVAGILGSPIIGVRIGNLEDRYTQGGIESKMEEVVKLMSSFREPVSDAGLKFAFENHAGDMRSGELLDLIAQTGRDICGAFYDPGNAIYAMEDPGIALEALSGHILCSQARDVHIWPSEDGAKFQWTAVGEGMMDFKHFTRVLSENCQGVPIHIETISNSLRSIPYLKEEYWEGFPDVRARDILDFLKLVRMGHPMELARAPAGMDKKTFDREHQKNELLRSISISAQGVWSGHNTVIQLG
jgi:sugar phosphate isomerase/epimerase